MVVMLEQLKVGRAGDVIASEAPPGKYSEHDEPLEVFCFKCNCLICPNCIDDGHFDHDHVIVNKTTSECLDKLRARLAPIHRSNTKMSYCVGTVMKGEKEIMENQSSVEVDVIGRSIDELIEALKQQKRQLLHEASVLTEERLSAVKTQNKGLTLSQAEAQSRVEFVEQSLERVTDEEVMELQQQIVSQVEEGCKTLLQMDFEPAAQNNMQVPIPTFSALDLHSVGQVYVHTVDPSKSGVDGKGVEEAEVNKPAEFFLQLADRCGHAVEGPCAVEVMVRSLVDGSVSCAIITPAGNGKHKATYTPRNRGQHSISVQLNEREMVGSPFIVFACLPPTQLKKPVKCFGGIRKPYGITISKSGEVIVAERCEGGEVVVLNKQGEKLKAITHPSVKVLRGVATDADGHIYVSSSSPQFSSPSTVVKFSQDGQTLLVQAKVKNIGYNLKMMRVINGQRNGHNHAIIVLDCGNLQEIRQFGCDGIENGELKYPVDVVTEKGEFYISDYRNERIQVFNMEGIFKRSFSVKDPTTQKTYCPRGLCIGPDSLLYVACACCDFNGIFAFTLVGECVASVAVQGMPAGIAVDTDGFLYVCMQGAEKAIEVF